MTIVLIVLNAIAFAITGMGQNSDGWLLTYGDGLHPVEWVAYNFLHFGIFHLLGNMFFLWAFGIVVEGKLGWWKFLALYLGIGIVGGAMIQVAMLWYVPSDPFAFVPRPDVPTSNWIGGTVYAQEPDFDPGDGPDGKPLPGTKEERAQKLLENLKKFEQDPDDQDAARELAKLLNKAGAGGASLVVYALMAVVLVWAPRNEIHCLWVGFRSGTFEVEYLYFCGFYIIIEILSAVFSARGFEVTSEIAHATGAMIGFGVGSLLVKLNWVDCENWDLYSIMSGKHDAAVRVGEWQDNYAVPNFHHRSDEAAFGEQASDGFEVIPSKKKKKKAKPKPKLMELESFDASFDDESVEEIVIIEDDASPSSTIDRPRTKAAAASKSPHKDDQPQTTVADRIHQFISAGNLKAALREYLNVKATDTGFRLDQQGLRQLADGLFKAKAINESAVLLDEYIRRFPNDADRQRVKLSVLLVKDLQRPTAALKVLAKVNSKSLPDDYRSIYQKVVREAQQMVADGITDA
jgi:membrane associated rhomboid family serine protease